MLTAHPPGPGLRGYPLTSTGLLRSMLAPTLAAAMLPLCAAAFRQPVDGATLILAILVFALSFPGRFPRNGSLSGTVANVLAGWLPVAALLLLLGWATRTLDDFDARMLVAWALLTPLAQIAIQRLFPLALPFLIAADGGPRVAIVVGHGQLSRQLVAAITGAPELGIRIAGHFDDRALSRLHPTGDDGVIGPLGKVADYARQHAVDLIYITLPMASQPRILRLLDELRDTTASIYFTPDIFVTDLIQGHLDTVGGIPVVGICETPHYGVSGPLKRASDLVLASLILILIAPLMLAIAIAIRRQSPGPVIFRQRRYGLDGREIIVYKFRTMTVAEDGGEIRQATRDDSRVTPLGAFLRRTSLDELPQFINVLQGRMSIVGPRPHAVAHNELYRKLISGYMLRHKVRPGITGWAQVNGLRGETDTLDKMQKRVDYDLAYLRDWSLRWDLEIILKTVFVVLKKSNAY
ncbi:MAG TPA: undecaprenyl-phosphate glucose phosphotransferase [Azonexus sp.]